MIERNTVLVLGAGASHPYGLPLGSGLREAILELSWSKMAPAMCSQTDHPEFVQLNKDKFRDLQTEFMLSGSLSIDAFLGCRPDLMEMGKLAIAACLLPKESIEELFPVKLHSDNWYGYFADRLGDDPDALLDNKVSIVTFNYDRSLEAYLVSRWQRLHRMSWGEAHRLVSSMRIVHVYGQLGPLTQGYGSGVPYAGGPDYRMYVKDAAKGLRLINETERKADSPEFVQARKWISEAETLCFLGFGFDETNLKHLGGPEIAAGGKTDRLARKFAASVLGKTNSQCEKIASQICHPNFRFPRHRLYPAESLATLLESLILEG